MCLGVPCKILEIYKKDTLTMGKVDFGGVVREVCFETLPDALPGEYAIVHVGFAISKLSEADALDTLGLLKEMNDLADLEDQNQ
ncbi:MAG: HypC/HybG/HupF family hydrogenase formation chaperone [Anaerolinea sp.]|nr:HypC/HybG/HupF family hydrogenase formation chaperone [Anaerolinea sp.]